MADQLDASQRAAADIVRIIEAAQGATSVRIYSPCRWGQPYQQEMNSNWAVELTFPGPPTEVTP